MAIKVKVCAQEEQMCEVMQVVIEVGLFFYLLLSVAVQIRQRA